MVKRCAVCGADFESNRANQAYCSRDCRKEGRRRWARQYSRERYKLYGRSKKREGKRASCGRCLVCGRPFERKYRGQKYCSLECHEDPRAESLRHFFAKMFERLDVGTSDLEKIETYAE